MEGVTDNLGHIGTDPAPENAVMSNPEKKLLDWFYKGPNPHSNNYFRPPVSSTEHPLERLIREREAAEEEKKRQSEREEK